MLGTWAFGGLVLGLLGERYGPHTAKRPVRRSVLDLAHAPVS